jgi:adenylate cyclase
MGHSPIRQLLAELKRRRVYRVAAVYVVVGWVLLQLGNIVVEPLRLPEWTMPLLIVFLLLGFPVAVVLAWAFDLTPEGVRRTEPLAPPEGASASAVQNQKVRNAGLIGLGMLIAVLGIGSYAFLHESPTSASRAGGPGEGLRSVAVLPFVNASPDAENEFFADGVMEDILTHLALVPDFSVISRTTVMRYKGSPMSVPEIAAELGVQYILEGSVRRAGDQVRITAQLIDGSRDQHLWAETYDRRLEDIFAVQTEIATAIAGALEAELSTGVASRIERRPTDDLEAYDLFLKGREDFYRYTIQGTEDAMASFRAALDRDPEFALARAWLGRALAIYAFNHGAGAAWADSSVMHARRAVAQQPDLAAAQTALGTALATSGILAEGQAALERAVALNPNDWAAIANLGLIHAQRGRQDEAIRLTRLSLEREPARSYIAYTNLGGYYGQLELLDQAEANLVRALALEPGHLLAIYLTAVWGLDRDRPGARRATADRLAERATEDLRAGLFAAELYGLERDPEMAAEVLAPVYGQSPTAANTQLVGALYGWALEGMGRSAEAAPVLAQTAEHARRLISQGNENPMLRYSLAIVHSVRGEMDEAFRWLDDAVGLGWNGVFLVAEAPFLEGIRDDPRFPGLLERVQRMQREVRERVLAEEDRRDRGAPDR